MTTDNFCFYLQNRLIQTSKTGGQWYSDTSPFSIPWPYNQVVKVGEGWVDLEPVQGCQMSEYFYDEILLAHYAWKVPDKGFKIKYVMH